MNLWEQVELVQKEQKQTEEFSWSTAASQISQIRTGLVKLGDLLDYQEEKIMKLFDEEMNK